MTIERFEWRASPLGLFLCSCLGASFALYLVACYFAPQVMSTKFGDLSLAVVAAILLLFANIAASVAYYLFSNAPEDPS